MAKLTEEQKHTADESLHRARSQQCIRNELIVIMEFEKRGIPTANIKPRENCLTFWAWKALGRSVTKGEKGVQVETWYPKTVTDKQTGEEKKIMLRKVATVFHESQTETGE